MQCLLARRCTSRAQGRFEYLVGWAGYGVEGDTWEPELNLPKALVAAYNRKYDLSVEVVLAALRERFHSILLESKRGKFGASFYMNIDPVVAGRVLHALAARRSGVPLEGAEADCAADH